MNVAVEAFLANTNTIVFLLNYSAIYTDPVVDDHGLSDKIPPSPLLIEEVACKQSVTVIYHIQGYSSPARAPALPLLPIPKKRKSNQPLPTNQQAKLL